MIDHSISIPTEGTRGIILALAAFSDKLSDFLKEIPHIKFLTEEEIRIINRAEDLDKNTKHRKELLLKGAHIDTSNPDVIIEGEQEYTKYAPNTLTSDQEEYMNSFFKEHKILSKHPTMFSNFKLMEKYRKNISILITGEPGTGKEGIAKAVHSLSGRKGNFRSVNAAGMSGDMFKDKLFGHVKGAYASANEDRAGEIELAHNGTLFLDEIGDIEMIMQKELLDVLQTKIIQRDGSPKRYKINFRLLCATNKNIKMQAKDGKIRDDFLSRLNPDANIHLPSLNERSSDIPLLSHYFFTRELVKLRNENNDEVLELMEYKIKDEFIEEEAVELETDFEITSDDFIVLRNRDWSDGNIRKLENYMKQVAHAVDNIFEDLTRLDRTTLRILIENPKADLDDIANISKYQTNPDYKLFHSLVKNDFKDLPAANESDYGRDAFITKVNTVILQIGKDVSFNTEAICGNLKTLLNIGGSDVDPGLSKYVDDKLSQIINASTARVKKLYNKKVVGQVVPALKKCRKDLITN